MTFGEHLDYVKSVSAQIKNGTFPSPAPKSGTEPLPTGAILNPSYMAAYDLRRTTSGSSAPIKPNWGLIGVAALVALVLFKVLKKS